MAELALLQVVGSEPEAEVVIGLLRSEGIQAMSRTSNYAVGISDAASSGAGPREILVREQDLARAREILEQQEPV